MDVVTDAVDLPGQQLEAVVDGSHVAGERVATGHPVVDVDLAASHIKVLVLQLRKLDLGVNLLMIVPPVGSDAWYVVWPYSVVSPESFTGIRIVPIDVPHTVRILTLPYSGR